MKASVRWKGVEGITRPIHTMAAQAQPELGRQMRVDGEEIMTDIKDSRPGKGVPRDEGTLAGSGRVTGPDESGAIGLTFGGAATSYALRQHEDLTLQHPLGEARYLVRGMERFVARGGPRASLWRTATNLIGRALRARAQARTSGGQFASGARYRRP